MKILLMILILNSSFLMAQSEKAQELVKVMEITKMMDSSQQEIIKYSESMIAAQGLSSDQQEAAKKLARESMMTTFGKMKSIDWNTLFAEIYAENFSDQEIQELINFYKSPIGQKMLERQPAIMKSTMTKMQTEMVKIMPELQADIKKAIEDVSKNK